MLSLLGLQPGAARSAENPNSSLTWTAPNAASGVTVTSRTAMTYGPFWQLVSMISGDLARLPIEPRIYIDGGRVSHEAYVEHQSYKVVKREANDYQSAFEFWRMMFADALIFTRAHAWIDRNPTNGRVKQMIPITPGRCRWWDQEKVFVCNFDPDANPKEPEAWQQRQITILDASEVYEIRGVQPSGWTPNLVREARNAIGLGLAAEGFNSKFFANGAQMGGILEVPAAMTKDSRDNLERDFIKRTGPDNWFKVAVLKAGAKFHGTQVDPEKSQTHELRDDQARDLCRYFNTPPSKIGLQDSVSYNSKSEDNRAYHDQTLAPWTEQNRQEAGRKLTTKEESDRDLVFFKYDVSPLFAGDLKLQSEVGDRDIKNGTRNVNEVRAARGMNPRDGGEEYVNLPQQDQKKLSQGGDDARAVLAAELGREAKRLTKRIRDAFGKKQLDTFVDWFDEWKASRQLVDQVADNVASAARLCELDPHDTAGELVGELMRHVDDLLLVHAGDKLFQAIADTNDWRSRYIESITEKEATQ